MKKPIAALILSAAAAAVFGQAKKPDLFVGDSAPPLVIAKWVKGEPVQTLGNGQITVVEFWATWCGPCKQSIPHLTELAKKYEGKATFVGVDAFERIPSADDCYSKVSKFVTDFGDKMDYHVAMDGTDGTMAKTWMEAAQQPGIPTAFVIDRDGKVAWIGHPMMGLDETVQKVIDGNFDEKAEADKELTAMAKQQESQAKQAKYLGPVTTALRAKDFRGAVKAADAAIAADASFRAMLIASEPGWMAHYDESGATKLISTLADNDFKDNAMMLNQLAWGMIGDGSTFTHPDTALAVKIAERAVKLSKGDPNILDTLGLAYFKAGRTKDAVSTEQKAILTASQTKDFDAATLTEFKTRLASFEKPIASS